MEQPGIESIGFDHVDFSPARESFRHDILDKLAKGEDSEVACCYHPLQGTDFLVSYHGSGGTYPETQPVDFFVFEEFFRASNLIEWQEKLLTEGKHVAKAGNASISSLKATHIVSFHKPITKEVIDAVRAQYALS